MKSLEEFVEDLKKNMNFMTRSDLQGCVEAYCIQTGEDKEKILNLLDKYKKEDYMTGNLKKEIIKILTEVYEEQTKNNRFEMSINHKEYTDCYFKVSAYETNSIAMCITIYGKEKGEQFSRSIPISNATVYSSKVSYNATTIALKEEYIDIFKKLGIIKVVRSKTIVGKEKARTAMDYTDRTFAICEINQEKLKKYCTDWNYQFE